MDKDTPIGAVVDYEWLDDWGTIHTGYVSFGEYDDATNLDTYDTEDDDIFCYVNGEAELIDRQSEIEPTGWRVISYTLVYLDKEQFQECGHWINFCHDCGGDNRNCNCRDEE